MNTARNDRGGEDSDDHQKVWFKLSIGQSNGGAFPRKRPTKTMKLYTCSFCGRKFHSPQALGGHQNAHRRERLAVKSYHGNQVNQSMDMHSLVGTARSHGETDNEAREGILSHVQPSDGEKLEELKWYGSSHSYLTPASQQQDSDTLDLNLKL